MDKAWLGSKHRKSSCGLTWGTVQTFTCRRQNNKQNPKYSWCCGHNTHQALPICKSSAKSM